VQHPSGQRRFRFDQFEVDISAAELRRNGRKIPIQDKPLRLLAYLSERSGQVVSRTEIQEHLWPPDTTVVFEDGLNTAVKKLREALNDNSDNPRYIETVRRRGYRFLGKVQAVATEPAAQPEAVVPAPAPPVVLTPAPEPAVPRRRFLRLGVAAGVIAVCASATLWIVHHRRVQAAAVADTGRPHAIAVLPIANLTGNPKLGYLCDGATEEIIARLGDEDPQAVRVIARTSAMSLRNTTLTARQIGDALGVDYLLEGSLQGDEHHIRLIAELVRVSDQTQLWTQTYIGGPDKLQEFENDLADRSARSLPGTRTPGNAPQQTVVTAEAHDLYLQGLYAVGQRSRAGFETALISLGNAVQKEPRYAEAYAELAVAYNLMGQYNWMRQDEARSQGRAAAMQALALDPSLAEARAALGFSYWFYDWDNDRAREELTNAVARQPNNVDAHHWLAMALLTGGQLDQSERQMREALALDPASPILKTNLGWVHYTQGRFPLAVQEMTAVVRQNPGFISAHYKLISAAFMMGDRRRGFQETQALLHFDATPGLSDRIDQEYEKNGYAAALKLLVAMPDDGSYANEVEQARYLIYAGDPGGAIGKLQEGLRVHNGWMIFVPTDPAFTALRKDPAFQQILQQIQRNPAQLASAR